MLYTGEEFIELANKHGELMYLAYTIERYQRAMKCPTCLSKFFDEGGLQELIEDTQKDLKEKSAEFTDMTSPKVRKSLGNSEQCFVALREMIYRK